MAKNRRDGGEDLKFQLSPQVHGEETRGRGVRPTTGAMGSPRGATTRVITNDRNDRGVGCPGHPPRPRLISWNGSGNASVVPSCPIR